MTVFVPDGRDEATREREYREWLAVNDPIDDDTRAWARAWAEQTRRVQRDA